MGSLAIIVVFILSTILVLGLVAIGVAVHNPKRVWSRVVGAIIGSLALLAGAWLALIDVGLGARIFGGVVAIVGAVATGRSIRKG